MDTIHIEETASEFVIRIPKTFDGIKGWDFIIGERIKTWIKATKAKAVT
jgi:hypothetical protein